MAAAETARLIASLELQDKNFTRGIRNVERGVNRVDKKLSAFGGFVNRNLARGVDRFAASLVDGVFAGVESLKELEQQQAQTNAVIKSTGAVAGVSGEQVTKLAEKYESLNAIIGDEIIRSGENMLLTFTNIHKDAFEPTLEAVLDMNTALGKGPEGLTSTAMQVGKALNDPTKGLTKLQRAGVTFTKGQIKQIKQLQKSGDLLGAQKIILKELNREFGGSFAAQGDTTAGKVAKFNDAVEDLQRTFAKALLPIISKVADKLGTFLGDPAVVKGIEQAGETLGQVFDEMLSAAERLPWAEIGASLKIAGTGAKAVLDAFLGMPSWVQAAVISGWGLNKLTGGKLFDVGKIAFDFLKGRGSTPANPLFVTDVTKGLGGGAPVPGAAGGGLKGVLTKLAVGVAGLGGAVLGGLTIAAIAPIALFGLTKAIIDATGKPIPVRDLEGRQATAERRGLNPAKVPVVRPSNLQESWYRNHANLIGETRNQLSQEKQTRMALERNLERVEQGKPVTRAVLESRRLASADARTNRQAVDDLRQDNAAKQAANKAAIERAKAKAAADAARQASINSAQTAAIRSGDAAITSRVSTVSPPVVSALYSVGSQIVSGVWAATTANRSVIQPTNVIERYTTIVRTGSTSGSRRSGPLEHD